MESIVDPATRWLIYIFVVSTMLSIGLRVTARDIGLTLTNRAFVARTLLINLIVIPLLGLLIIATFSLSRDTAIAILLLSLAPGGINALQFTEKVAGHSAMAAGTLILLSAIAIILTPAIVQLTLLAPVGVEVNLPYNRLFRFFGLFLVLPLLIGFLTRRLTPGVAKWIVTPAVIISNVSFVGSVLTPMALKKEAVREIGLTAVLALLILILGSMLIGWVLGGPTLETRRVSASTASMRNASLCLIVALASFPGQGVYIAVLAFVFLVIPANAIFTVYHAIKERKRH